MRLIFLAILTFTAFANFTVQAAPTNESNFLKLHRAKFGPVITPGVAEFAKSLSVREFTQPVAMIDGHLAQNILTVLAKNDPSCSDTQLSCEFTSPDFIQWTEGRRIAVIRVYENQLEQFIATDYFESLATPGVQTKPVFLISGRWSQSPATAFALLKRLYNAVPITATFPEQNRAEIWNDLALKMGEFEQRFGPNITQLRDFIAELAAQEGGITVHEYKPYYNLMLDGVFGRIQKSGTSYGLKVATIANHDIGLARQMDKTIGGEGVITAPLIDIVNSGHSNGDSSRGIAILHLTPQRRPAWHRYDEEAFRHMAVEATRRLAKYSLENPAHNIRIVIEDIGREKDPSGLVKILRREIKKTTLNTECQSFLLPVKAEATVTPSMVISYEKDRS